MMGMMHSKQLRIALIEVLNDINSHKQLDSEKTIETLGHLLKHVLTRKFFILSGRLLNSLSSFKLNLLYS
jgi:hypothetical protein